jgi:hypothetical protein
MIYLKSSSLDTNICDFPIVKWTVFDYPKLTTFYALVFNKECGGI